ncbi:MAG TPA: HAD family hydrolase [Pseudomonadales bacterium]|nr:HAD family hydrolase [Pseudomonadales bacterium]
MALAIFDLDNTLLGGDSDHAFGEFLIEERLVDALTHRDANDRFYRQYMDGTLDIHEYLSFALKPLTRLAPEQLVELSRRFVSSKVTPLLLPKANALLDSHRQRGDTLLIITATNRFVTEPIAELLGVPHLIATEPEKVDGRYTGRIVGTPSFQHGKIVRLDEWLQDNPQDLDGSYFYSDSMNDLPLLQQVEYPVAVNPDARLRAHAEKEGWPILDLRGE